jgi:hypothetical protein
MRGEPVPSLEEATAGLELADQKTKKRLEKIRDMVLFRYGSTGVWAAVQVRAGPWRARLGSGRGCLVKRCTP